MRESFTVSPVKVHILRADASEAAVTDIIQSPEVQVDPSGGSITVSAGDRVEQGSMEELIASARGLKVTCGRDGEERKSLHLAFSEPAQLDEVVERLEGAGLTVIRSQEDPDYRSEG